MSNLVRGAFAALGTCPSRREVQLVAQAIRDSGDPEVLRLFEDAAVDFHAAFVALEEIAVGAGSGPFVVLDLLPEVLSPGWQPFPTTSTTPAQAELERRLTEIRDKRGVAADGSSTPPD